jgi:hypothetical protein
MRIIAPITVKTMRPKVVEGSTAKEVITEPSPITTAHPLHPIQVFHLFSFAAQGLTGAESLLARPEIVDPWYFADSRRVVFPSTSD